VTFARSYVAPFRPVWGDPASSRPSLHPVLLRVFSVRLAAPLDRAKKMLLTDVCNRLTTRAPVDRLVPDRVAFASPTAHRRPGLRPFAGVRRRTTLRQSSPGSSALDGASRASVSSTTPLAVHRWTSSRGRPTLRPPRRRGVVDHARRWRRTSDALCRAPQSAGSSPTSHARYRGPIPRPLVKEGRFCRPRAPSIDKLLPSSRSRGNVIVGARHRYLGFAASDPASDASSPPRCSRAVRLDPMPSRRLFTSGRHGPNVACRLLQPTSIREHNRSDRPNPAHHAHGRPRAQLFFEPPPLSVERTDCGWPCFEARPTETSRARGRSEGRTPFCWTRRLSVAIARGGSFTPTRSARTPLVAIP
jgi:hypothetical protein